MLLVDQRRDCVFWVAERLAYLKEIMLMTEMLFALATVVEVFAHRAFVTQAYNRAIITAIAVDVLVDDLCFFWRLCPRSELLIELIFIIYVIIHSVNHNSLGFIFHFLG